MMCVETLSEFIEWASRFKDGQYLFRGVPNDNFEIKASAYHRLPGADSGNPSKLLRINKRLIEDARSQGHDQKNGQQLSDLELLAELQHFGAATCLIDFSRSALAALWFACLENPSKEKEGETNGKVFAVRHGDVDRLRTVTPKLIKEDIDSFFQPDESDRYPLYQWTPKLQNNRIIAQHSVFLFGGAQIEPKAECVIIKDSKQEILKSLAEISDITEATMYPDFDGFARLHAHDKPYVESDAQDYLQHGVAEHQNNNLDDAINYYTKARSLDPDNPTIYRHRGAAYRDKGDYDRAIDDFREVIRLNRDDAQAYNDLGHAYYMRGLRNQAIDDFNTAIDDFNRAIQLDPDYTDAYFNRGDAYKRKGDNYHAENDYDLAIADFTQAIERKPDFVGAYNHRGVAHRAKGDVSENESDYDLAIKDFIKAIELDPNNAEVHNNLGITYRKKGEIDRAIEYHNKAIECKPDFGSAYYNRGLARLLLKEWERAKLDLTTAKEKGANIGDEFAMDYKSVSDFEGKHGIQLPPDIAAMLTSSQA